ncbi:hypothetical protein Sa4125_25540 [Aureimonas sp. SA4125]|uniref:hypothetical protein n=1 Tax=Aureimonas sp. SA4125 TaxID=2826993 RepID=UPI001CC664B5|nr:hypothetical protein [Aureimonas sp. SA4125]BDA85012.1 hypothetical protein Sa4125_25540 [Aureimonas sp. SA4125]
MITGRQRTEQLLIIEMLVSVTIDGADPLRAETKAAAACLSAAVTETIAGLPFDAATKLYGRRDRLFARFVRPHQRPGMRVATFGLAVFHLLKGLTESGTLSVVDGSAVSAALDLILPGLEPAASDPVTFARARKIAFEILDALQGEGLFPGATIRSPDDA